MKIIRKLSYGFIFLMLLTLTGCFGSKELGELTELSYDGSTITWNEVKNASYYTVKINNIEELKINYTSYNVSGNKQDLNVVVKAYGDKDKVTEISKNFIYLETIKDISISKTGEVVWEEISSATGYEVYINGNYNGSPTLTNSFSNLNIGNNDIKVRPILLNSDAFYSSLSASKRVTLLDKPTNINYDGEFLSWNGVPSADSYDLVINGETINVGLVNRYAYDADEKNFDVKIKAIGDFKSTVSSAYSDDFNFKFLGAVKNLTIEEGILHWDEILDAEGYEIKINGVVLNQKLNDNFYKGLEANKSLEISIKPYLSQGNNYFSSWSYPTVYTIIKSPVLKWHEEVELDGNANTAITWDGITNASGYTVRLTKDGQVQEFHYGAEVRSFSNAFAEVGDYLVEVKAVSTKQNNFVDSYYSAPITIKRLAAPKSATTDFITSNASSLADGFTVNYKSVAGAKSYRLFKDGLLEKGMDTSQTQMNVTNIVPNDVFSEQSFIYAVQSVGEIKKVNNQIYVTLSSLTSESLTFDITVSATPSNAKMAGYELSWDSVSSNNGYVVRLDGVNFISNTYNYDLSLLEVGDHRVQVAARGNGSNVLSSNLSSIIDIKRLSAPTNIRISTTDVSEGLLLWDSVLGAKSYDIVIDSEVNPIVISNQTNMYQYITTEGSTFHLRSLANYYEDEDPATRKYFMTSGSSQTMVITRFSDPRPHSTVKVSENSNLIWEEPNNYNSKTSTITYNLYNHNKLLVAEGLKSNTYDVSNLEGGRSYTFYVKAIGNGTTTINSELSEPITFTKLATPNVEIINNRYEWNAVAEASGYAVYIDGELQQTDYHQAGSKYYFVPKFESVKTYKVEIVALGNNGVSTINSNPATLNQKTMRLNTPEFSYSYSEEVYSSSGLINLAVTVEPDNANGYTYIVGGTNHSSTETTFDYNPGSTGVVKVGVYANGGIIDDNEIYYISSQIAGNNNSTTINLLHSVNKSSITLTVDLKLKWSNVVGSVGYEIELLINDSETITKTVYTNEYLIEVTDVYKVVVRVRALGNNRNVITGSWTEEEFIISN